MRVAVLTVFPLAAIFALVACGGDAASARASLLAADQAFSIQSSKQGFDAAFATVAEDDVVFLPDRGAALKGRTAVEEAIAQAPAGTTFSWTPQQAEAQAGMGYSWGVYELNGSNAAGQPTLAYGKYLSVWKKQAGDWKLQAMMLNQSPGPAG